MTTGPQRTSRRWLLADLLAACLLTVYLVRPALHARESWLPGAALLALAAGAAVTVALRRLAPWPMALVALACGVALDVGAALKEPLLAFVLCAWTVSRRGDDRRRLALAAAGVAGVLLSWAVQPELGWSWMAVTVAAMAGSIVLARALALGARSETARREAEADAALARQEAALTAQRLAIARDLHDIVGNGLGMIALRADVARSLREDETALLGSLDAIQETARGTLDEVRHLVGMLRDGSPRQVQAPSIRGLDALLTRVREQGIEAGLEVRGDLGLVPAGVSAAGYRIVQEAVSNALRHARPNRLTVCAEVAAGRLVLEVANDGVGTPPGAEGHGIRGMRERAGLYGGTLTAACTPAGFQVRGFLPLGDAA